MTGDVIAERYELEQLVGRGGMSSVYRAKDRLLERTVAIKVLHEHYSRDEDYVERFRREARAAARLSHPNIVTVIDRGEADGRQFIVFEYIDGQNLKQLVESRGRLPVRTALELGIEIGRALAFAHESGLVHRDVKPQNVLLGNGDVKVTDFGIARSGDVKQGLTQTGTVLGTSDYIAPEQASGQPVSVLSDVYSLGVVVYELLAGEPPYKGDSFLAVAMRHVNDPVPSVATVRPDVPLRLDAALRKAMAKDPADRFESMAAFCEELLACLRELEEGRDTGATLIARPPRRRARAPRAAGRRASVPWLPLALAALLAAAAVAAAVVAWRETRDGGGPAAGGAATVAARIHLSGVAAYDPDGSGGEHDAEAPRAADGDPGSYWTTETYHDAPSLGKPGVGVVLDAGAEVEPAKVGVVTDTPGFAAEIRAGDSPTGPFRPVSGSQRVDGQAVFELHDAKARYFVVWITRLGDGYPFAHVNEVKAA